jgi:serine/threonine-protein kinase HipA
VTFRPAEVIEVAAWGRLVGAVARDPETGLYAFEYAEEWLKVGVELSLLHLPRRRGVFEFPELRRESFHGLPAMLADALPDRFGSALVNAWMAAQGIDPSSVTALDRLAYAGDRAMGALSFAPPVGPPASSISLVQVADLVTAARAELAGTLDERGVHDALAQLITVGSSAGGARAKAVIAYNPTTDQMRSGQLHAPEGFEQWILKLDGVGGPGDAFGDSLATSQPYCRVEYAYYLMATRAGVEMSESRLLLEGPRAHFMTKRFDRGPDGQRIHMQSLCALAHLDYNLTRTHSYSSYFQTAESLGLGRAARHQLLRRVAFNVMAVNRDDHTKNFAFLLPEDGTWTLAPNFDVTHSNWSGEWTAAHQMSVNGKFIDVTLDDLRSLGDLHDVPAIDAALTEVAEAVQSWPEFAAAAGLDALTTERIAADLAIHWPK